MWIVHYIEKANPNRIYGPWFVFKFNNINLIDENQVSRKFSIALAQTIEYNSDFGKIYLSLLTMNDDDEENKGQPESINWLSTRPFFDITWDEKIVKYYNSD
ncbi:hypothetical protein [[Mycoplasma] anseris]|uniref:Uncharacterized protein n=1 Tax=[Mycoplasma] anseris TaxID=92400 RepID=A0A2Z4ND13_9BACT|nr:hypothetical protein [[Mycoplasma] anseris]AWX69355.1 hypothetical protein DP065_01115 [[Mycoplasma] anseris]